MNHFNFKSLAFYGVAIGSVLLLFKTVTAYGESNLKAPATISDRYRLTLAENLPNCENLKDLILNIQQSGIYVNASLLSAKSNVTNSANNQHKNSLSGILNHQQLNLSGKIDRSILCQIAPPQDTSAHSAIIQIQLKDPRSLTGQLTINGISQSLGFTAVPQTSQEESQKLKNHS
jgi:hypothetical protein